MQKENFFDLKVITDKYDAYTDESARKSYRNQVILARSRAVDLNYYTFLKDLYAQHNMVSLTGDMAALGLTAAGTVWAGELAKSALAAAATGVVGTKTAIDTDLFYQKTLPALVAQMDAGRKSALVIIRTGLAKSTDDYPLEQGLADLDTYYVAGTLPGAVSGIIQNAGIQT